MAMFISGVNTQLPSSEFAERSRKLDGMASWGNLSGELTLVLMPTFALEQAHSYVERRLL